MKKKKKFIKEFEFMIKIESNFVLQTNVIIRLFI